MSSLYKRLQVSHQTQLLTSSDPCVRRVAEDGLRAEESSKRVKFCPAVVVRDVMQEDPSRSRKALTAAVKTRVTKEETTARVSVVHNLPRQGHMVRSSRDGAAEVWAQALSLLLEGEWKFVLNAAHNTLPHNNNLHLWKKKQDSTCPLCKKELQTLIHVLNACTVALNWRRYNTRHDAVLAELSKTISQSLPQGTSVITDIGPDYSFLLHQATTDLCLVE